MLGNEIITLGKVWLEALPSFTYAVHLIHTGRKVCGSRWPRSLQHIQTALDLRNTSGNDIHDTSLQVESTWHRVQGNPCPLFCIPGRFLSGRFLSNLQDLHLRCWTFCWQFWTFWNILWTFQYAAGFRGPGILIKRSTIVDLSVRRVAQRSRYLIKHPNKILKNIQKSLPRFHI